MRKCRLQTPGKKVLNRIFGLTGKKNSVGMQKGKQMNQSQPHTGNTTTAALQQVLTPYVYNRFHPFSDESVEQAVLKKKSVELNLPS
ncbi:MAG: hypothetical protein QM802_02505 [Agriterribacter sp.]